MWRVNDFLPGFVDRLDGNLLACEESEVFYSSLPPDIHYFLVLDRFADDAWLLELTSQPGLRGDRLRIGDEFKHGGKNSSWKNRTTFTNPTFLRGPVDAFERASVFVDDFGVADRPYVVDSALQQAITWSRNRTEFDLLPALAC